MLNNVMNFGAEGNGATDDRAAIQRAISDAVLNQRGGIFFPAGTYRVCRSGEGPWSLVLDGVRDFTVAGEGPRSVVQLVDAALAPSINWHVFVLKDDCRRVVFRNLVIDGNRLSLTPPIPPDTAEQLHGIEIEGAEDVVIDGCILRECFGDGVRALGEDQPGKQVKRLRITNSLFQRNSRAGLVVQRATKQIIVSNCMFEETVFDQSIDFEPSGSGAPANLIIDGCIIVQTNPTKAVTLSGIRGAEPLFNCKFTNNIVIGGPIFCTDVHQLTIQNNIVMVHDLGTAQRIPVEVQRGGDAILITGNLLVNDDTGTDAVISLAEVGRGVARVIVADNLCIARSGNGIQCLSTDDVRVHGNMIVAAEPCKNGVLVRSHVSDIDEVSVQDNTITARDRGRWDDGITIAAPAPHQIRDVSVTGNSIRRATTGITFQGTAFDRMPVCALNRVADNVNVPIAGIEVLPNASLVIGGAVSRGGAGRCMAGRGDPNGRIDGRIGDIFQRLDGGPGATLYVKEGDEEPDTGWSAK